MFPHTCGKELAEAARNGADPRTVVPDGYAVVRGGIKPIPPLEETFSAVVGPDLQAAASAVPNGQVRVATAGEIRQQGGIVEWLPEISAHGTLDEQHVHVTERGATSFSEPRPSPVPKRLRIDGGA
jgi:hypothetical protein